MPNGDSGYAEHYCICNASNIFHERCEEGECPIYKEAKKRLLKIAKEFVLEQMKICKDAVKKHSKARLPCQNKEYTEYELYIKIFNKWKCVMEKITSESVGLSVDIGHFADGEADYILQETIKKTKTCCGKERRYEKFCPECGTKISKIDFREKLK